MIGSNFKCSKTDFGKKTFTILRTWIQRGFCLITGKDSIYFVYNLNRCDAAHHELISVTSFKFLILKTESSSEGAKTDGSMEAPVAKITPCFGQWKSPRGCDVTKGTCEYHATWEYFSRKDEVKFTIITTNTNYWTGIGFSDNQKMVSLTVKLPVHFAPCKG